VAGLAFLMLALVRNAEAARGHQERAQWWRNHSLQVMITAETLDTALNKALRGERGFVLTGHPNSLAMFKQGFADYRAHAGQLRSLTRDNAGQQRRLTQLAARVEAFRQVSQAVVELAENGQSEAATAAIRTGREREAVEQASAILDRVKADERRLLAIREADNAAAADQIRRAGRVILWLNGALVLVIAAAVMAMLRARDAAARSTAAVRESERLYRLLAEHSDDMIVRIGLDGIHRYVSPASKRLLGFAPEEMVGGAPDAEIHVEDRARVMAVCETLLTGSDDPICTYRQQHRDGHYVWLEAAYRLIRDDAGTPIEFVASVRDVSRRRAVELAAAETSARLQENNRLFAMASSLARIGHWRVDLVRGEVIWSDEVHTIYGVAPGHHPTLDNAVDAYHPDDRERVAAMVAAASISGLPFDYTGTLLLGDGSTRTVAVQGMAEHAPDGEVVGLFGVIQDVSTQIAAERAIRESEQQYRLLADNATDVILRTGDDGFVLYISPSCAELSGYRPDELVGRHCGEFIHPDDLACVHAAHVALIGDDAAAFTVEYRLQHKSGDWRWLESHMKPWRAPDGEGDGVISSIRDIGARKAMEADLVEARDRAENAARVKATFLANMSHEIRTPMNGVLGFTELVLAGDLSAEQRRHVDLIAESGRSMMRLLNDILDMSKIESGKMQVCNEPVDLRHTVRRCADLMTPVATAKGVALRSSVEAGIPLRVVSDPLRLRQVMLNLLGNAVKFTERGEVTLEIGTEGASLRLAVTDTGIGIPAERLPVIFDQFAQADESTARLYGGTGLGLAISAELVRLMGGTIAVRSIVGEGTSFIVHLPLQAAAGGETAPVPSVAALAAPSPSVRRPRVLIAEDHDINQELILAMAVRAGMDPTLAINGLEAVAMVEEATRNGRPFELILMDMQMPELDGLAATRRLRQRGYGAAALPIVALTANAYAEDIQACLAAGMQEHLAKPVRVRDLTDVLSRLVPGGDATRSPEPVARPALIDRYRARKAETLDAVERLADAASADDAAVTQAAELLHKLAGTAGMFGEAELGDLAKRLEDELRAWPADARAALARDAAAELRRAA
jgi:PAS domain S-box-containing protein